MGKEERKMGSHKTLSPPAKQTNKKNKTEKNHPERERQWRVRDPDRDIDVQRNQTKDKERHFHPCLVTFMSHTTGSFKSRIMSLC